MKPISECMKDPRWWKRPRYIPCGNELPGYEPDEESIEDIINSYREFLKDPKQFLPQVPDTEEFQASVRDTLDALEKRDWVRLHNKEFFGCPITS